MSSFEPDKQPLDKTLRSDLRNEVGKRETISANHRRRGCDTKLPRKSQEPAYLCGPGHSDPDGNVDADLPEPANPRDNGISVETELRGDLHGTTSLL